MDKNLIVIIIAAALLFVFVFPGAFSFFNQKDGFYDQVMTAPASIAYGEPIAVSIQLKEKPEKGITNCDINGMGNRVTPDTTHFCQSYTYFNARSIRVKIDGEEQMNFYYYPIVENKTLITQFSPVGAVCCLNTCGMACSVCQDQNIAGLQSDRAYFFSPGLLPPRTSLDGKNLFTLNIPNTLKDGTHNVEVYFFEETIRGSNDNTCVPPYGAREGGTMFGDQNQEYNYYYSFNVNVTGQPVVTPPTNQNGGTSQPPEQATNYALIGIALVAAFAFWKYILKN